MSPSLEDDARRGKRSRRIRSRKGAATVVKANDVIDKGCWFTAVTTLSYSGGGSLVLPAPPPRYANIIDKCYRVVVGLGLAPRPPSDVPRCLCLSLRRWRWGPTL